MNMQKDIKYSELSILYTEEKRKIEIKYIIFYKKVMSQPYFIHKNSFLYYKL